MPRSPAQSDFVIAREPMADVGVQLPAATRPVELPTMVIRTTQASAASTKWVMRFALLALVLLAILCAVGPHIPSGG